MIPYIPIEQLNAVAKQLPLPSETEDTVIEKRLSVRIGEVEHFSPPIVFTKSEDGKYWECECTVLFKPESSETSVNNMLSQN